MGFAEETVQIRVRVLHVSECRVQKRVVLYAHFCSSKTRLKAYVKP